MSLITWIKTPFSLVLRSQEISFVFSRHGLGGTLKSLGGELGKRGVASVTRNGAQITPLDAVFGKNLALTLSELGPTFIKLGQLLAQRPDWVGEVVSQELRILFDRVPPIPFKRIEKILKSEWGKEKFKRSIKAIDRKPLASASLSQTHRATLADGRDVILKVQKSGVERKVTLDLKLIEALVAIIDPLYPKLNLKLAFSDFKQATLRELDYREEAKNIDRFQQNNRGFFSNSSVVFPSYEKTLLTAKVIVLEPMRGKKASELKSNSRLAKRAAFISASAVLEQIFEHGFFHADPHAGNLFFMEDSGKVGFIDLGLVGQLEEADRIKFTRVMLAIVRRDRKELAKSLYELGVPSKRSDFAKFESQIDAILDDVKKIGVKNIKINRVVDQLFRAAHENQIFIPNRYILMIRSCLMIDGVAKQLDQKSSLAGIAGPILAKSLLRAYNPLNLLRSLSK